MSEITKEQLTAIGHHVHQAVRMLKLGETATISCSSNYPTTEVRQYLMAYSFHKRKWFEVKHDATSNVLYATRVMMPSFIEQPEEEEPDAL